MEGVINIKDCESRLLELEKTFVWRKGKLEQTSEVEDLMMYLDLKFTAHIAVSDTMKLEFILAEDAFLAALLEQVSSLLPVLDSSYIKAIPKHVTKLQRLSQIHMTQQEKSQALSAAVRKQVEDYNKMMVLLSKQFFHWDQTL